MANLAHYFDQLFFVALPYVAFFTFFLATITRYVWRTFTYSSLSSQFLENRQHFWGMVPFHYGIIVILTGHVVAWLVPRQILWWNSRPARLYILEISALIFGLLTLIGLVALIVRRLSVSKIRIVTSKLDWIVLLLLLNQVASGIEIAVRHPWGSSWFATLATPYLWSIARLNPDLNLIAALPFVAKLHIVNAWLLILIFPFSRLVHILVVPNPYLWRKPQVVRWYRPQGSKSGEHA